MVWRRFVSDVWFWKDTPFILLFFLNLELTHSFDRKWKKNRRPATPITSNSKQKKTVNYGHHNKELC